MTQIKFKTSQFCVSKKLKLIHHMNERMSGKEKFTNNSEKIIL